MISWLGKWKRKTSSYVFMIVSHLIFREFFGGSKYLERHYCTTEYSFGQPHVSSPSWNKRSCCHYLLIWENSRSSQFYEQMSILDLAMSSWKMLPMSFCMDNFIKFLGVIEVPKGHLGNSEEIFNVIKSRNPKDIKKVESIASKESVKDFTKIIAP